MKEIFKIVAGKNEERVLLLKIKFPKDIPTDRQEIFALDAVNTGLTKGLGAISPGESLDMGETMHEVKAGIEPSIIDASTSNIDMCIAQDVLVNKEGTMGVMISLSKGSNGDIPDKEKITHIIQAVMEVALSSQIEFITEEDIFEEVTPERIKKVLLNQVFPESNKTIKEVLEENGVQVSSASIFSSDRESIIH